MKLVITEYQQDAFKEIVEVIKFLAEIESREALDAIDSMYRISKHLGVQKDLDRVASTKEDGDELDRWRDIVRVRAILRHGGYVHSRTRRE